MNRKWTRNPGTFAALFILTVLFPPDFAGVCWMIIAITDAILNPDSGPHPWNRA